MSGMRRSRMIASAWDELASRRPLSAFIAVLTLNPSRLSAVANVSVTVRSSSITRIVCVFFEDVAGLNFGTGGFTSNGWAPRAAIRSVSS